LTSKLNEDYFLNIWNLWLVTAI